MGPARMPSRADAKMTAAHLLCLFSLKTKSFLFGIKNKESFPKRGKFLKHNLFHRDTSLPLLINTIKSSIHDFYSTSVLEITLSCISIYVLNMSAFS